MNWYYVEQGQQAGPVDDAQLEELRRSGRIQADTLIWREGMANWSPYSEVKGGARAAGGAPPPAAGMFSGGPGEEPTEAVCTECGKIFPKANMIRYGTAHVCAGCKPLFMQKLTEGAPLSAATMNYAGFWIRFAAKFVDGIILGIPFMVVFAIVAVARGRAPTRREFDLVPLLIQLAFVVVQGVYTIYFVGKYGATPGKMVCKLKIVSQYGESISYGRATGRFFAEMLSGMICYIGYIMVGFDSEKRALHDHICSTRVVYKDG
jgi:uncharacterized RDD family membrane protein YckC